MTEPEFKERVIADLTELKVTAARLEERMKPLLEAKKDSRNAFYSALGAFVVMLLDMLLRR